MKEKLTIYVFGLLLFGTITTYAQQKKIVISDDLAASAEKLKVIMGTQWMGKIWQFKFGEYAVKDSKNGWTTSTSHKKFFSFKVESASDQKFSFVLGDKTKETAQVNVTFSIETKELQTISILTNYYVEQNVLLSETQSFSAFISTSDNEEDIWVLVIKLSEGKEVEFNQEAFFTNGVRWINVLTTSSNLNGNDSRSYPALGYEFVENDVSLCAVQYYGGGALGYNKNVIWLKSDLDERDKLLFAAAMTSLLQKEVTQMADMD